MCPVGAHLIWKYPIYKFLVYDGIDNKQRPTYKEIHMDVRGSIPDNLDEPSSEMKTVLDETLSRLPRKPKPLILDFGAGNLRNTMYLLKKGYQVRSVEFKGTKQSEKKMEEKTEDFREQYKKLVFPHEFFNSNEKFGLILLMNVCTIMPVPSERLLAIQYCREKLTKNGLILWFTIHGDKNNKDKCTPDNVIGDGHYFSPHLRYQTFYRDLTFHEVDDMFYSNGLVEEHKYVVSHNVVKTYKRSGNNPITPEILNAELIRTTVKGDLELEERKVTGVKTFTENEINKSDLNDPNPDILREEQLYINALRNLAVGDEYARDYHNLMYATFLKLFVPPLTNPKIEYPINQGDQRVDIVMRNSASDGFFSDIITKNKIHAPYLIIECKNYRDNVGNPELSQTLLRFKEQRGKFGFIVYRSSTKEKKFFEKCVNLRGPDSCIIPLNDLDIIEMLRLKLENESVDEYLGEKLQKLDFNN